MTRRLVALAMALAVTAPVAAQYFGKNKIRYDTFDWKVYPTPHFRISYYDRGEPSLAKIASFAESAYDDLARRLNFQVAEPVPLLAFATHTEFEQTNVIVDFIPEGVGAFATPARNRMVLPIDLPDAMLQQLIQHELVHIFQYEILFQGKLGKAITSRPPDWFMEGMASYFAADEDARDRAVMRDAVLSDRVPSVADPVSGYFAYRFGHMVFEFTESEWGIEGVRDLIFEFRNVLSSQVEKALRRAFDLDVEEFDARFRAWLRTHYQVVAADRGDPREFGLAFRAEEGVGSAEGSPVASPSGDLIAAFSTYDRDLDVVLFGVPDRRLFRNLTRGYTTEYEYLVGQLFTVAPDRGRDLAFSPDGNTIAVFARRERGRVLLLVDVTGGGITREYELPGVDQAMEPVFSRDGGTIAFHAYAKGRADIYFLDLVSGAIRNFTDDEAYDADPVYTPDGQSLVYTSETVGVSKIYEASLADPSRRRQLTFGAGDDEGAAFSRDAKRLYFSSDRDGGVFDIYGLDLETRELTRLTWVIGAAINPTPVPTRDGERVVYQAYTKGSWQLYITDPTQGSLVGEEEAPRAVEEREPFVPAVSVTVSPDKVEVPKKRQLFVEDAQVLVGVNEDQTFVSQTYISFTDHYGDRRVGLLFESVSGYSNFQFSYFDLSERLQWGATVFDDRAYFIGVDTVHGQEQRLERLYRQTGGAFYAQYPISRYYRVEGTAGYYNREAYYPTAVNTPQGPGVVYIPTTDRVPFLEASLVGDTTLWQRYGPHGGNRWQISFGQLFDLEDGGSLSRDLRFDARQYIPLSERNELALRLWAAMADGNRPNIYWFGGLDTLRGYEYASFAGNRAAYLNAEWRFPLIDHLVFPWLYLRDVRARLFIDVGAAWFDIPGYDQQFTFMEDGKLKDGVSSYGFGISANLLGLPMHWDFAKRWDFKNATSDRRASWWIGFRY